MTSPVVYSVLRPPKVNKGRTMLRVVRADTHRWQRGDRLAIVAKKRVNLLQIAQGVKCTHHEIVAVNPDEGSTDTLVLMGTVPPHDWRTMRLLDVAECERLARSENDNVYTPWSAPRPCRPGTPRRRTFRVSGPRSVRRGPTVPSPADRRAPDTPTASRPHLDTYRSGPSPPSASPYWRR